MSEVAEGYITAEMLRQYYYCPRKIYWMYVWGTSKPKLSQVKVGLNIHEKIWKGRRVISKSNNEKKILLRKVYLRSKKYPLIGIADAIILREVNNRVVEATPIEIKNTFTYFKRPEKGHVMQLLAYILMTSEIWHCDRGILYYRNLKEKYIIKPDQNLISELERAIEEIRKIIIDEFFPDPTPDKRRCKSCEVRKLCRPEY